MRHAAAPLTTCDETLGQFCDPMLALVHAELRRADELLRHRAPTLQTDADHCGDVPDTALHDVPASSCTALAPAQPCAVGPANGCGGACVDTSTSTVHCGGCAGCGAGVTCDIGEACDQRPLLRARHGVVCDSGPDCTGACIDINRHEANCGGCGAGIRMRRG